MIMIPSIENEYNKFLNNFTDYGYGVIINKNTGHEYKDYYIRVLKDGFYPLYLVFDGNQYKVLKYKDYTIMQITKSKEAFFYNIAKVKIKQNPIESIKVFKNKNKKLDMWEKSVMENKTYNIADYFHQYTCKQDNIIRNIILVQSPDGKNLKFVDTDVEIILPDFNDIYKQIKNYNIPKNKSVQLGSRIKLKNYKKSKFLKSDSLFVCEIYKAGIKNYAKIKKDFDIDNKFEMVNINNLKVI